MVRWVNDPDVRQYLGQRPFPMTLAAEEAWFDRVNTGHDDVVLAIIDKEAGVLIGTTGLHQIDWISRTAVTGTLIGDKSRWGQGFGTDAKMTLLRYAFETLNLRKVSSHVIAFNERSLRCQQRCGYHEEARLSTQWFRNGQYWDEVILAIYQDQWPAIWQTYQAGR